MVKQVLEDRKTKRKWGRATVNYAYELLMKGAAVGGLQKVHPHLRRAVDTDLDSQQGGGSPPHPEPGKAFAELGPDIEGRGAGGQLLGPQDLTQGPERLRGGRCLPLGWCYCFWKV